MASTASQGGWRKQTGKTIFTLVVNHYQLYSYILNVIRDDTQNGSTVETVAAEAGKDKNNKEGLWIKVFFYTH